MFKIRNLALAGFFLSSFANYAQYTDIINSNRPGKSFSAFSVGKTVFQAETGMYGIKEKHDLLNYEAIGLGNDLSLRYGAFFEQLELSLDMQYQYDNYTAPLVDINRNGFKQTTLGAKYLIYDPFKRIDDKPNVYSWKANYKFKWRDLIPAVAVYGGINIPIGPNEFSFYGNKSVTPKAVLITQNHFNGKWVFVTNIILDKLTADNESIGYVATLTRGFNMRWSGFIENQGIISDPYSDGIIRVGAAYLIKENVQIDASVSKNIKDTPSLLLAGVGLSWRFDLNYEDVVLRLPKASSDKKSKKGKKGKDEKSKKRKDEVELEKTN